MLHEREIDEIVTTLESDTSDHGDNTIVDSELEHKSGTSETWTSYNLSVNVQRTSGWWKWISVEKHEWLQPEIIWPSDKKVFIVRENMGLLILAVFLDP